MQRVCVFCGSNAGRVDDYLEAAGKLGAALAARKIALVYGGASVGLMGAVANAAQAAGGEVIGVMPRALVDREIAHTGLKDLRVVGSMHERKAMMAELSVGFIALPGGLGTMEEFFEVLTWSQLGLHAKPCGLLNVSGYFDPLLAFLDSTVSERFVKSEHRALVITSTSPTELLERLAAYRPPHVEKWIDRSES